MSSLDRLLNQAVDAHRLGDWLSAERLYRSLLDQDPLRAAAWHGLGVLNFQLGRAAQAVSHLQRAVELEPRQSVFQHNLGKALAKLGRHSEAITTLELALSLEPGLTDAWNDLGNSRRACRQQEAAQLAYLEAIRRDPQFAIAHYNLGIVEQDRGHHSAAVQAFRQAISLRPDFVEAHHSLGLATFEQGNFPASVAAFEATIRLNPDHAEAHCNLGNTLQAADQLESAAEAYRRSLHLAPQRAETLFNLGNVLNTQGKLADALSCYTQAHQLRPELPVIASALVTLRQHLGLWEGTAELAAQVLGQLRDNSEVSGSDLAPPFQMLCLPLEVTAREQRQATQRWVQANLGKITPFLHPHPQRRALQDQARKLRIGYLSSDFHAHATSLLLAETIESHDREGFEVFAYSYGIDDGSPTRRRMVKAFDVFRDIRHFSWLDAAKLIYDDQLDILVDLKGYTAQSRPEIVACRPAPIQCNFLGYPGTMGAEFIDYIIGDNFLLPADQQPSFSERLLRLPGCYQPNDSKVETAARRWTRADCGLPESGFVFCCFNNAYKITPDIFDVWMRLLAAVPGSVLWLLEWNRWLPGNLRHHAQLRGIEAERLIFGPRLEHAQHLARAHLADVFLDTYPVTAHTTCSDTIRAEVPLVTRAGSTFIARVAGSILNHLGLPELVTTSLAEYEATALRLAQAPTVLADIKDRLRAAVVASDFFDGQAFARKLEAAYRSMYRDPARRWSPPASAEASPALGVAELMERAMTYEQRGEWTHASDIYQQILQAAPDTAAVLNNFGNLLWRQGNREAAAAAFQRAMEVAPDFAEAFGNYGLLQQERGDLDQAIAFFRDALQRNPKIAAFHYNLGRAFEAKDQLDAAETAYRAALERDPELAPAWNNLGNLVSRNHQDTQLARQSFERALAIAPDFREAKLNLARILLEIGERDEAQRLCEQLLAIEPKDSSAAAILLEIEQSQCDWRRIDPLTKVVIDGLRPLASSDSHRATIPPLIFMASPLDPSPAALQQLVRGHSTEAMPPVASLLERPRQPSDGKRKIRVGYLSGDFGEHPIGYLIGEMLEAHDRSRFELFGYSLQKADGSRIRRRLEAAFDRFVGIEGLSSEQATHRIAADALDILIDLGGHTKGGRLEILRAKPASVQAHFLGFAGTLGLRSVDYLFADRYVIPSDQAAYYCEKIVYLPGCFMVHDSQREINRLAWSREQLGLPAVGFIFCGFTQPFKLTQAVFERWLRIIKAVPESFLWLRGDEQVQRHLKDFAGRKGVGPERLIFAPWVEMPLHIGRQRYADLFLDTYPYNQHSTAADALRVGLPLLTVSGQSFASRVAGSLLTELGMTELIAADLDDYEHRAIDLARHPQQLHSLREKLGRQLRQTTLFDGRSFIAGFEAALTEIWKRFERGELPSPLIVARQPSSLPIDVFRLAEQHAQAGRWMEAESLYTQAAVERPADPELYFRWGICAAQRGDGDQAVARLERAIALDASQANYRYYLGLVQQHLGELQASAASYAQAIQLAPDHVQAWNNLGNVYRSLQQPVQAEQAYRQALTLSPALAEGYCNLGLLLAEQGRPEEARNCYEHGILTAPPMAETYFNLGNLLVDQGDYTAARQAFIRSLELKPSLGSAYVNLANLLRYQGELQDVRALYLKAIELDPNHVEACFNFANFLQEQGEFEAAIDFYRKSMELRPDCGLVAYVNQLQMACSWSDIEGLAQRVISTVDSREFSIANQVDPYLFVCLPIPTTPAQQYRCARVYGESLRRRIGDTPRRVRRPRTASRKIKLAYLSSDLHPHPIPWLVVDMLESHNRDQFEVFAYSYGPTSESGIRRRITQAVDVFREVSQLSNSQICERMRDDGIDILVDLKGYTYQARTEILAMRPAPIQCNFLGYCGSMGTDFFDYVIADEFILPEDQQPYFSEAIVRLPGCYYPNDRWTEIAQVTPTRAECGLPTQGFVFCSFNSSQKLNPRMFGVWMRLLQAVPGSVLWLLASDDFTCRNLRAAATSCAVPPERLIFAPRLPRPTHLARHRHADLFLDSFPYNGHTTASDALRMGVPLVTLSGESFASRVAGSLLKALTLDSLVTFSLQDYEALARELARNPEKMDRVRGELHRVLERTTVFDGRVFAGNIEKAYRQMWENFQRGEPPRPIRIEG
jgi:predicted O-linked N-acetylglucosamine transferase (SPINDLY family)